MYLAEVHLTVLEDARTTGLLEVVGEDHMFSTVEEAVNHARDRTDPSLGMSEELKTRSVAFIGGAEMRETGSGHAPHAMALPLGAIVAAMRRDPDKMRILTACTLAAVAVAFEPPYLTLSTSVVQLVCVRKQPGARLPRCRLSAPCTARRCWPGYSADIFGRRLFLLIGGLVGLTVSNILSLLGWMHRRRSWSPI